MSGRLMAKVFGITRPAPGEDGKDKGSGFQSKFNAFSGNRKISAVHSLDLEVGTDAEGKSVTHGLLLYEDGGEGKPEPSARVYAKTIEGVAHGTGALQTKVNSFSKDKSISVLATATVMDPTGNPLVVILYTKEGGDSAADAEAAQEPAEVAQDTPEAEQVPEPAAV